ncbi:MAG: glycogen-binding domain-containing protein [Limisphaerales bacterium]
MSQKFGNAFLGKPPRKGGAVIPEIPSGMVAPAQNPGERRQTYSKVFRWRLPEGQTQSPATVEVIGTFTNWQKVRLMRDGVLDAWHVTLHHLHCGRMHHYMLLVDGQPVRDRHCDGLAVPHGPQEEQYQLVTDRGPRVLMLFSQAK